MASVHGLDDLLENAAYRLAAAREGRVSPLELATVAPATVDDASRILDRMVDRVDVRREDDGTWAIPAATDAGALRGCLGCGTESKLAEVCPACTTTLDQELRRRGADSAWRTRVAEEHALLRAVGERGGGALSSATIAGESAASSERVRALLDAWAAKGLVRAELVASDAPLRWIFPKMAYPATRYARVLDALRLSEPAPFPWRRIAMRVGPVLAAVVVLWGSGLFVYNGRFTALRLSVDAARNQVENVEARQMEVVARLAAVLAAAGGPAAAPLRDAADAARTAGPHADLGPLLASIAGARAKGVLTDKTVVAVLDEVTGAENRVRVERMRYNEAVTALLSVASSFPGSLYWSGPLPALL